MHPIEPGDLPLRALSLMGIGRGKIGKGRGTHTGVRRGKPISPRTSLAPGALLDLSGSLFSSGDGDLVGSASGDSREGGLALLRRLLGGPVLPGSGRRRRPLYRTR